jgi:alginate O-acetyltransferase complex protein AlgJ
MQSSAALADIAARRGGPTDPAHDAKLRRGVIDTAVSPGVAATITVLFLLVIYAVPVGQVVMEKARGDDVGLLDLFRHPPDQAHLHQFEKDLEQASYFKDFVQPRVQLGLTRFGRVGNKRAVVGRGGWLYYKPGITYLSAPSFLDAEFSEIRRKEAIDSGDGPVHPDPRPAIFAFSDMLAQRGIRLVLFPVPDKAAMQPGPLHGRPSDEPSTRFAPARNTAWPRFVDELRAHGVAVFDPTPSEISLTDERFLVQDTHWTPAWMEEVAQSLAHFVESLTPLPPPRSPFTFHSDEETVRRVGDLVDMLKLPDTQTLFLPQPVTIRPVRDEAGADWEPDPNADVLLLGDSFTNVFSLEPMGWGTGAGLAPRLSLALRRPLDVIAQNDAGAHATRQLLARELAAGEDRLATKRVVIWEFASRELGVGDWRPIDWDAATKAADSTTRSEHVTGR